MADYSNLTRKDQVLERLRDAQGGWVDGPDLANDEVGGSEGLKRLRELRQDGYDIRMRGHPDPSRDVHQYRLVPNSVVGPPELEDPDPDVRQSREQAAVIGQMMGVAPAEVYDYKQEAPKGYQKPAAHLGKTVSGEFVVVYDEEPPMMPEDAPANPAPGQQTLGVEEVPWTKFDKMPKLDLGTTRRCPLCKGYRKPIHKLDAEGNVMYSAPRTPKDKGKPIVIGYEDFCRDPRKGHGNNPCERCNGFGVVPA